MPDQPAESEAIVTEGDGELSVQLPPAGLRKGSKGLFTMAVLWNAIVLASVVGVLVSSARGGGSTGRDVLILTGVLALFGSVGVWLLVGSISMGKRHTIIDVVGDSLLISTTTPFRTRQHTFLAADLHSIKAGPSGTEINEEPVLELQIRHRPLGPPDGAPLSGVAKLGLLSSRPDDELRWLAALLTQRLGLAPAPPEPEGSDRLRARLGRSD